jgi:hypothetical protein
VPGGIGKPLSEYSKRQKLRQGYEQSLEHTQKELSQALEHVSTLDVTALKSIRNISEKASRLWVLLGAQRCRLLIAIHGLNTTTESLKPRPSEDHFVELVVRPELRRIGDSAGELFDSMIVVAGCEGEIIKILY